MPPFQQPPDWPFETLKLGEYFSYARQAAEVVRQQRCEFSDAVSRVLADRQVTERERSMLIQKTQSIVYLGLETN